MENQSSVVSSRLCGGTIQIRQSITGDSEIIVGKFPYDTVGRLSRARRETIQAGAFTPLNSDEVHLLANHEYGKPLARTRDQSLSLTDHHDAVTFIATLPPREEQTTWQKDTVLAIKNGLIDGISPGFLIKPGAVSIRGDLQIIKGAWLRELSIVTRPVYTSHAAVSSRERRAAWTLAL